MDIFEDLLTKTQGFPADRIEDLRSTAETLSTIAGMSKSDLQEEVRQVIERLPEMRAQRAQQMREAAKQVEGKDRQVMLKDADTLARSSEKLALPDAEEQYKRRAALVELSVRLKAQLREVSQATPELDPVRLKKFDMALGAIVRGLPDEVGSKADRSMMARMTFVHELRDAGGNVDLAVDNFYTNTFGDNERGHWGDAGLEGVVRKAGADVDRAKDMVPTAQQTQDYVHNKIVQESQEEHDAAAAQNALLQDMPKLAAEHLSPKEYACYRVMIDNEHLMDWNVGKDGKIRFKAKTLDANSTENTVSKILQRDLNYQNIRGANLLIENTVDKLNKLMVEKAGQDVQVTEKAAERMGKTTQEIVSDPAAQAKPAPTLGKPRKGKGVDL